MSTPKYTVRSYVPIAEPQDSDPHEWDVINPKGNTVETFNSPEGAQRACDRLNAESQQPTAEEDQAREEAYYDKCGIQFFP